MDNGHKNQLETRTINTALRPPRVAVFLDNHDKNWKDTVMRVIEILSSVWGGDGYILIPTDGEEISPYFQELLKQYDPDFVIKYQRTGHDFKKISESKFNKFIDTATKNYLKQYPDSDKAEVKKHFEEEYLRAPFERKLKLGKKIKEFILKELSVFHYGDDIQEHAFEYSGSLPHVLPKLRDVLLANPDSGSLQMVTLNIESHNIFIRLIGYCNVGRPHQIIDDLVEERRRVVTELPKAHKYNLDYALELQQKERKIEKLLRTKNERFDKTDFSVMVKSFWNRKIDIEGLEFRAAFRKHTKGKKTKEKYYDYFPRLPFSMSNIGLSYFMRRADYLREIEEKPLLVVGDGIADFCLYYSLVRLRKNVYWLPYSLLTKDARKENHGNAYSFFLVNELLSESRHNKDKNIDWISLSVRREKKKAIPKLLAKNQVILSVERGKIEDRVEAIKSPKSLLSYILRLYEKHNANNYFAYQFIDNKGINFIDTPRPKTFEATDPIKHKWITEVSIENYIYPTSEHLSDKVFQTEGVNTMHLTTTATRVSSNAIHYQCPAMSFIRSSDEVGDILVRPKLNIISAQAIFEDYFKAGGYTIRPSDKGNYFLRVLDKFNNLDSLARLIKQDEFFKLFELYMTIGNRPKTYDTGVYSSLEKRRYIDFASIASLLENPDIASTILEKLLKLNILYKGYVLKCNACKNSAWYPTNNVDSNFKCLRCSTVNFISKDNLGVQKPDLRYEPIIYYKLDELFYQFWCNNGYITVLTLHKLKGLSSGSLIFLPETEFRRNPDSEDADFEIDILAIIDGKVILGEAKKDANSTDEKNRLKPEQIGQLINLSSFFPLSGLVFSSWSSNWPSNVARLFQKIEDKEDISLTKFVKDNLFTET